MKQAFDNRHSGGALTNPEKENSLNDFNISTASVLFGFQSFCEIFFMLVKGSRSKFSPTKI
jgi:hypothetical protein